MKKPILILALAMAATGASAADADSTMRAYVQQQTAQNQVEKLVARLDSRSECAGFRSRLLEQSNGSPYSGATQYAIADAWQRANRAGCIVK